MPWKKREQRYAQQLAQGIAALGMQQDQHVSDQLLHYHALLHKWNQAFNLTAVRDPLEMIDRHLLDSLSLLPYVEGKRVLDMGTGAGLPGIPLAICLPQTQFVLLDSNGKKIRFVRQAMMELGLQNVEPVQARLEAYQPVEPFDLLISRAFTGLANMLKLIEHLVQPGSSLLAMKGKNLQQELATLPAGIEPELIRLPQMISTEAGSIVRIRFE
ncbi:16S rRNA methyltransferase [Candidatus Endoriftia persephone str. Guaymas]|nr:16S rRNA methyltransferase [Candidatus Endoriftia persephone str. Guaymas]